MKGKINYVIIGLLIVSNIFFMYKNRKDIDDYLDSEQTYIVTDTIYSEKIVIDTVTQIVYEYIDRVIVDTLLTTDSVKVPVYVPISKKEFANTIHQDGDTITYKALVSGYKSELERIDIKVKSPIVTNTVYLPPRKRKFEINHGPQIGGGYGFINKKFDIYAGYGLQIKF